MVNEWNNPKPQSRHIKRKKEKRNNQVASAIYKVQGKKEFKPKQSKAKKDCIVVWQVQTKHSQTLPDTYIQY